MNKTETGNTRGIATIGVLIALAMIFSYVESLIPIPFPVPGIKLGFANIVVVFAIYKLGMKSAICISLLRVVLSGLLFGNFISLLFSFAGASLSLGIMAISKKYIKLELITVSILGGIAHVLGQLVVAAIIVGAGAIAYYIPALLLSGFITGGIVGAISGVVIKTIGKN